MSFSFRYAAGRYNSLFRHVTEEEEEKRRVAFSWLPSLGARMPYAMPPRHAWRAPPPPYRVRRQRHISLSFRLPERWEYWWRRYGRWWWVLEACRALSRGQVWGEESFTLLRHMFCFSASPPARGYDAAFWLLLFHYIDRGAFRRAPCRQPWIFCRRRLLRARYATLPHAARRRRRRLSAIFFHFHRWCRHAIFLFIKRYIWDALFRIIFLPPRYIFMDAFSSHAAFLLHFYQLISSFPSPLLIFSFLFSSFIIRFVSFFFIFLFFFFLLPPMSYRDITYTVVRILLDHIFTFSRHSESYGIAFFISRLLFTRWRHVAKRDMNITTLTFSTYLWWYCIFLHIHMNATGETKRGSLSMLHCNEASSLLREWLEPPPENR